MNSTEEKLVDRRRVTYTPAYGGRFYIVENVPARVDDETGEQFFSPTTVENLQRTILRYVQPRRIIETPVYEYSEY